MYNLFQVVWKYRPYNNDIHSAYTDTSSETIQQARRRITNLGETSLGMLWAGFRSCIKSSRGVLSAARKVARKLCFWSGEGCKQTSKSDRALAPPDTEDVFFSEDKYISGQQNANTVTWIKKKQWKGRKRTKWIFMYIYIYVKSSVLNIHHKVLIFLTQNFYLLFFFLGTTWRQIQ